MISQELTDELRVIVAKEFGKKLTRVQASNLGEALLRYANILIKMKKESEE